MNSSEQLIKFLQQNIRYSYNAPSLYKQFKGNIPMNTIRSELRRLEKKGKLLRETRGFYRFKIDEDTLHFLENPHTLLHGIMVSMNTTRKLQNGIHGIPSPNYNNEVLDWLSSIDFKKSTNYRFYRNLWFDDRKVTITIHLKGRIDVYLHCSNHPVSYMEFRDIFNKIEGFLLFLHPFYDQRIVEVGVAKDFMELRLDGLNSLSFKTFVNSWERIYRKESMGVTRIESHVKTTLSLEDAIHMLERLTTPTNGYIHKEDERRDVA